MLRLAGAGRDDVFFDLGSGWGQNLIVALGEFRVRKAVGIESDPERIWVAQKRLKRLSKNARRFDGWRTYQGQFENLFEGDFKAGDIGLEEATIVFYGLDPAKEILEGLERKLAKGTRLVTYYLCLFPEIMPAKRDYPFFLSIKGDRFEPPRTAIQWLSFVVDKKKSTLHSGPPDERELWDELSHDHDVDSEFGATDDMKRRLAAVTRHP